MRAGREEPRLAAQDLSRADADPHSATRLGRHGARRILARDGVAGEDDARAGPSGADRDEEVVHRGRVRRKRTHQDAPRGVDRAVGADADAELALGLLGPGLAVPEIGLRRPAARRLEDQPPAHRADARIREAREERSHGAGLEARVRVGEDEDLGVAGRDEVVQHRRLAAAIRELQHAHARASGRAGLLGGAVAAAVAADDDDARPGLLEQVAHARADHGLLVRRRDEHVGLRRGRRARRRRGASPRRRAIREIRAG